MDKKINYKVFGEGYPIVIMHGLLGMLDNWQTFAKRMANNYMVYTIDLRNHGKSFHDPYMDYPDMAEDLKKFMEDHHMFNAHIMGHSMGGKVAMQFALENPEMVDKLIVADIAPHAYSGGHEGILQALQSVDVESATDRKEVEDHLMDKLKNRSIVLFLMKNLSRTREGNYQWKPNLDAIEKNYEKILEEVNCFNSFEKSSLFLKGGRSEYINNQSKDSILGLFPNSEIVNIPKAGHWIHADAPEETLEESLRFLSADN